MQGEEDDNISGHKLIACMIISLFSSDENKFNDAANYYLKRKYTQPSQIIFCIVIALEYIYIPGHNLEFMLGTLCKCLVWTSKLFDSRPYFNMFVEGLYTRSKSLTEDDQLCEIRQFGVELSICLPDEVIESYIGKKPLPIPNNYRLENKFTAGYWNKDNIPPENYRYRSFAYRPDLLNEIELLSINENLYISSDNYYYYLIYKDKLYSKYKTWQTNNLDVYGYNVQLAKQVLKNRKYPKSY